MLPGEGKHALDLGWEKNNFYVWTKQKGANWCMVQSVGKGKYSATINGVRLHPLRMFFTEAIDACEEQPQPKPVPPPPPPSEFDTEGLVANTIKKILVERYTYAHEIDGILSSGSLEDVLLAFYNHAVDAHAERE